MAIATKTSSKPQPLRSLIEKARNIHCRKENIPKKNVESRCKSDSKFTKLFPPKNIDKWQKSNALLSGCNLYNLFLHHSGNCMKYLNTLNKVQIDQKSAVGLPTVPAYCLTITLNFLLC